MTKKKKYKIHYDRLIVQTILLALVIFGIIWLVSLCSSDNSTANRQAYKNATEAGHADALRVINTHPGTMKRDEALLFIRYREHMLRSNGHGHAADDYINSARKTLAEHGIK